MGLAWHLLSTLQGAWSRRVPCAFAGLPAKALSTARWLAALDPGVGAPASSSLLCTHNWPNASAGGFSVFAGVGERTREGNDLYKEMIESVSLNLLGGCTCVEPKGVPRPAQVDTSVAIEYESLCCRVSSSWVTRHLSPSAHWCTDR